MKKFIKIFFSFLLIVFLYASWGVILVNKDDVRDFVHYSLGINRPCGKPLKFAVGNVDSRFGLADDKLIEISQEAAAVWNQAAGKEILTYDPAAEFKVNLVFDERQAETFAAEQMERNMAELEGTYRELSEQSESLNAQYQEKIDAYEKALARYRKELEAYNEEVKEWNEKGGAPKDVYEDLKDKKEDLESDYKKIEKMRSEINALVKKSNSIVTKENQIAQNFNANLETYTTKFGGAREFEKGIFSQEAINIYQFQEESDLRLTVIHELGHYLNFDHVENPKSIMYYMIGDQDLKNPVLSGEDKAEMERICRLGS